MRPAGIYRDTHLPTDPSTPPTAACLAVGQAYNEPHSKIVREDLERLAAEIAG